MALAVADELQGQGLGTILVGHLAEAAHGLGIATFEAEVLPENRRMIEVFRESGFPVEMRAEPGAIVVRFPTSLTGDGARAVRAARADRRGRRAPDASSAPRSVAVIGASRRPRGHRRGGVPQPARGRVQGPVYPVNPSAEVVQSVPAYPSVEDVPGPVDLAVIVVPGRDGARRRRARAAARACAALVVISAGFGEIGDEGRDAPARAARDLPPARHAADRPELHGGPQHEPRRRG